MSQYALTWGESPTSDDKTWALIAHLSCYVSTFVGPLVVMLLFQDKSKYVRYHAMQALALQVVAVIVSVIISVISLVTCGFGSILYLALIPLAIVPLYGAMLGWSGEWKGFPGLASFGRS